MPRPMTRKIHYPRLLSEIEKADLSVITLCRYTGLKYPTIMAKITGSTQFTLQECKTIKHAIGSDLSIETLFEYA